MLGVEAFVINHTFTYTWMPDLLSQIFISRCLCIQVTKGDNLLFSIHLTWISSSLPSLFAGLEYSAGEGTNYPPKFDSAPGKPVFTSVLVLFWFCFCFCFFMHPLFCLKLSLGPLQWYWTVTLWLKGAWRTATEEWGTEDWNEDVSVSGLKLMQLL